MTAEKTPRAVTATLPLTYVPGVTATVITPEPSATLAVAIVSLTPSALSPKPSATLRPTVAATAAPITITLFAAAPNPIDPGESITLTWQATGGQLYLYSLNEVGQMGQTYEVPASGTRVMTTSTFVRNHVDYVLFAVDQRRQTQAQVFVSIKIRCPDVWFFANGPASCPRAPFSGPAAIQHFEHGMMIWLEPRDGIYILYTDEQFSPRWDFRSDDFVEGQPESDPAISPPGGFFQPIRGFGLVWRDENTTPGYRVRDRLGWATDRERAFSGTLQCDSWLKYNTCFLRDADGRVIVLHSERSGWGYWIEP